MTRWLLALLMLPVFAAALPKHSPWPGGIAVIEVGTGLAAPDVRMAGKPVLTIQQDGSWYAVAGLPLSSSEGEAELTVNGERQSFNVTTHAYREQHLTVAPSYVNPSEEAMQRIASEQQKINAAIAHYSAMPVTQVLLQAPVPGRRSDSFGSRRFFNNEPRSPHRGMDLSGKHGTEIIAPLTGEVILTGDFYFTGNAVFIDHGQGLITLYAHLERIDVSEGQRLTAGELIGTVGATGRVTGPHLHFATYLNGTPVDPALLLTPPD